MNNAQKTYTVIGSVAVIAVAGVTGYELFVTPVLFANPASPEPPRVQSC